MAHWLKSPKQSGGVADIEPGLGNVLGDHFAGPDNCSVADRDWEDGSVCPNAHAIAKRGLTPEAPFCCRPPTNGSLINIARMRNEAVSSVRDELTDE